MKTIYWVIACCFITGLSGCTEHEQDLPADIDVESYIELLRADQYQSAQLPDFTPDDIPALLTYRNEKDLVTVFPRNPISSLYLDDCELGMIVMWTIESIRLVANQSEFLIMNFPSQNPVMRLKQTDKFELISNETVQNDAATAYYDWWQNHQDKAFSEFSEMDPLANTNYAWH